LSPARVTISRLRSIPLNYLPNQAYSNSYYLLSLSTLVDRASLLFNLSFSIVDIIGQALEFVSTFRKNQVFLASPLTTMITVHILKSKYLFSAITF
jgi:hypothetical protein